MAQATIKGGVTPVGKKKQTFEFRRIRLHEEEALYRQLREVEGKNDTETADARYKVLVDTLAEWAVDGKALRECFEGVDIAEGERLANDLVNKLSSALTPTVVF
jgi:hypothetical protein